MSITDELREYVGNFYLFRYKDVREKLDAIADRIDAEHEAKVSYWQGACYEDGYKEGLADNEDAIAEHGWVKLPVDADGVPIHAGDVLTDGEYTFRVDELAAFGDASWSIRNEDGNAWAACDVTHHHAPTVEDVLREFADEMNQNLGMYTGEAIDADEWRDADARTVEKFAERLELREVGA